MSLFDLLEDHGIVGERDRQPRRLRAVREAGCDHVLPLALVLVLDGAGMDSEPSG